MAFYGTEYAITGSAVSVATALGITEQAKVHCQQLILRAIGADAFWGASNVTTTTNRCGKLGSTDTYPTYLEQDSWGVNLNEIFLVGTAGGANAVLITVMR